MLLGQNLLDIGLIGADEEKYIGTRAATFCPHHVSHHLGMDVHDTPSVSKTSPLVPGMVITLEPGCYVPASMEKVDLGENDNAGLMLVVGSSVEHDFNATAFPEIVLALLLPKPGMSLMLHIG